MFSVFGMQPRFNSRSGVASRTFRIVLGLVFIYLGINMAGDLVRLHSDVNQTIKNAVYKYNSVSVVTIIVGDTANAISDSFKENGTPNNSQQLNNRAQNIAEKLSGKFRDRMPEVNSAVDDILYSMIAPFQKAISDTAKRSRR